MTRAATDTSPPADPALGSLASYAALRRALATLLALYGITAMVVAWLPTTQSGWASSLLHPTAGGMALTGAIALWGGALFPNAVRATIAAGVVTCLAPLVLLAPGTAGAAWPADASGWPAWLMLAGWMLVLVSSPHTPRWAGRLQSLGAGSMMAGGALLIGGAYLRLDLFYGLPQLAARPLPVGFACAGLGMLLMRQRSGAQAIARREELLISRIGLAVLAVIAFASSLVSFVALQDKLESALNQQLHVTLQNRQFIFYTALDAAHLNAAPVLDDTVLAGAIERARAGSPASEDLIRLVDSKLPPVSPTQTARSDIARAIEVRNATGVLARQGDFLTGTAVWSNTRKRSEVTLMWQAGVPYLQQRLRIDNMQRAEVGEIVIQQGMPAWEALVDSAADLGDTATMFLCGIRDSQIRCLRSRHPEALWSPGNAELRERIESSALYGEMSAASTPSFVHGPDGRLVMLAHRPLGRLDLAKKVASNGLAILITEDPAEFYAPIRTQLNRVVLIALPVILLGGLLLGSLVRPLVRALRSNEARFRELTELSSDGYWQMDARLRFVDIVGRGFDRSRIRIEDWRGRRIEDFPLLAADRVRAAEIAHAMAQRQPFSSISLRLQEDAQDRVSHLDFSGTPLFDEHGTFVGYRGVCLDMTKRRLAEQQLQQVQEELLRTEKLASLGRLVAGVAHELNTPLGNGVTVTSALASELRDFNRVAQAGALKRSTLSDFVLHAERSIDLIERSLERATHIVHQFREISASHSSDERQGYDLRTLVGELHLQFDARCRAVQASFITEVPPDLNMEGFPRALERALANLTQNAITHGFAARPGGSIRISANALGTDRVRITVADDGEGMSAATLARAFEPFFTTRLGTGGSGLGLYIAHTLVNDVLGGTLKLESTPGEGCTATIELPRVSP
ncbi:hypothetical protein GCM10025771_21780 [Niveibacterium umoris]|uniref:histidine kinase n=1 Tax=Niveibacterium umoris TaxID=1193620 RepID=A0A840BLV6_9RHOO|nr:PAS domain-containing sensor histidine kinase [Niveibacterium umoris]MBB4012632.1 signal transduction histidine kinase [Niveibacterium umoris]